MTGTLITLSVVGVVFITINLVAMTQTNKQEWNWFGGIGITLLSIAVFTYVIAFKAVETNLELLENQAVEKGYAEYAITQDKEKGSIRIWRWKE